jgi:hypothetical protein
MQVPPFPYDDAYFYPLCILPSVYLALSACHAFEIQCSIALFLQTRTGAIDHSACCVSNIALQVL